MPSFLFEYSTVGLVIPVDAQLLALRIIVRTRKPHHGRVFAREVDTLDQPAP